jgi:subtilisin family serine protease
VPGVVAVGATSLDDTIANFSNAGNSVALSAPGVAIWSTLPSYPGQAIFPALRGPDGTPMPGRPQARDTTLGVESGTSMATPHVTGAVALYLANTRSSHAPAEVRSALMDSADRVAAMAGEAWTPDYGAGRLNLRRLLL